MPSEVAEMRRRIEDEYHAMMLGLNGYAITARHDFIQARMNAVNEHCEKLAKVVGEEKALEIVMDINDTVVGWYQELMRLASQKKHVGKKELYRTNRQFFYRTDGG